LYYQGPLRAEVDRPGHVRFTEHGTWYSYYRSGAVRDTIAYGADNKLYTTRNYLENGDLAYVIKTARTEREGRSFIEEVDITFRPGNQRDTVSIRRWGHFEGEAKTVLDERIEFDEKGSRKPLQK
jgi:antitoxin component YwqK of YwqJK toxin-antitoxin module